MSARRASLAFGAVAAAAVVTGGGGLAPWSAFAWQAAAALALALAIAARPGVLACLGGAREGGGGASRAACRFAWAVLALAAAIAVSALCGVERSSATAQAAAWMAALALGGAVALASSPQGAAREEGCEATAARWALIASAPCLAIVLAGHLGWPLGGRAGATLPESGLIRPLGTFADPNHLTAFLVLVAAIHVRWAGLRGSAAVHGLISAAAALAALGTRSRLAAAAVILVALAEVARRGALTAILRSPRQRAAALALVLVAGAALGATLWARRGEQDAWSRPVLWRAAAPAVLDRPLTGLGPGGFQHGWWPYNPAIERGLSRFEKSMTTPHAEWLRVPIELGALGAFAALAAALMLLPAAGGLRQAAPLAAALAPFLAVHDAFHSPATAAWASAGAALLIAGSVRSGGSARAALAAAGSQRLRACPVLAASLLLALALGARWRAARAESALQSGRPADLGLAFALAPGDPRVLLALAPYLAGPPPGLAPAGLRCDAVLEEAERLAPRDPRPTIERSRLLRRAALAGTPTRDQARLLAELGERAMAKAPRDAFLAAENAAVMLTIGDAGAAARLASASLALEPALVRAHALRVIALSRLAAQGRSAGSSELSASGQALESAVAAGAARSDLRPYERDLLACEPELLAAARAALERPQDEAAHAASPRGG